MKSLGFSGTVVEDEAVTGGVWDTTDVAGISGIGPAEAAGKAALLAPSNDAARQESPTSRTGTHSVAATMSRRDAEFGACGACVLAVAT
mmetsp:Transcript_1687/g.5621  ORF Transcript_1687/g.5621 Transcript_1687/m.5621 type:complete len:89 (+) Transcript_1687:597-863(+)